MEEFRRRRNWADYDIARPFAQRTADDLLRNIDDIIRLLEALPTITETYQKVVAQMRSYETNVLREETWGK